MSTFRVQKNKKNPYFLIDTTALNDPRLSCKAKGLFAYISSKPDNWCVNYSELVSAGPDGIKAVHSGINELIKAGYLEMR